MSSTVTSNASYLPNREEKIRISRHAKTRCRQRGGKEIHVPLIKNFGEASYDGKGAKRYCMTRAAMNSLYRALGHTKQMEALEGLYIVLSHDDNTVITYGHLYQ